MKMSLSILYLLRYFFLAAVSLVVIYFVLANVFWKNRKP
jgi:hypothetical protein